LLPLQECKCTITFVWVTWTSGHSNVRTNVQHPRSLVPRRPDCPVQRTGGRGGGLTDRPTAERWPRTVRLRPLGPDVRFRTRFRRGRTSTTTLTFVNWASYAKYAKIKISSILLSLWSNSHSIFFLQAPATSQLVQGPQITFTIAHLATWSNSFVRLL